MRNRPAFELRTAIIVYNVIQVVSSIYIVYKVNANEKHFICILVLIFAEFRNYLSRLSS